jgi:hypothetical protein
MYGVGLGKTGTTTLARMFARSFRSAHEAEARRMVPVAAQHLRGDLPSASRELQRRSRLGLEVDVAGFLAPLAPELARLHPSARFVLTIRDCFTWLESVYAQILRFPAAPSSVWGTWRASLFPEPYRFDPREDAVEGLGLPPIRVVLSCWARTNGDLLAGVPQDRLMVVRTEDLGSAVPRLARFCGIEESSLDRHHENPGSLACKRSLCHLPKSYLLEVAEEECSTLMVKYWGDRWLDLARTVDRDRRLAESVLT